MTIWSLLVLKLRDIDLLSDAQLVWCVGHPQSKRLIGHQRNGRIALLAWLLVASLLLVALWQLFRVVSYHHPGIFPALAVMFVLQSLREPRMTRRMMPCQYHNLVYRGL